MSLVERLAVVLLTGDDEGGVKTSSRLLYIPIDPAGAWKQSLARELDAAGIPVAYEKIPPS